MATILPETPQNLFYDLQASVTKAVTGSTHEPFDRRNTNVRRRNTIEDFELNKRQKLILKLLPKCGWAEAYINIIANLGSISPWRPYYKGEYIDDPYLQNIINDIRPEIGTQKRMRRKALRLQTSIGLYAMTNTQAANRVAFNVWHPNTIEQSRLYKDMLQISRSPQNQNDIKHFKKSQVRRYWTPDDLYDKEPYTDLYSILDKMDLYCCALEAIRSKTEQGKIFNNLLHLKLENTEKNPFWANPNNYNQKTGKLQIDQSIHDLQATTRAAYQGDGQARFSPYTFIWPGDVNHIKLDDPISVEMLQAADEIAKKGIIALPIPTPLLTGEEGLANHWGDAENHRQLKQQTLQPALELHDEFWTEYAFKPELKLKLKNTKNKHLYKKYKTEELSIRSDTAPIDNKPDNSAFIFELFKEGIATRKQVADAANLETVAPLPEGIGEYDHWLKTKGKTTETVNTGDVERPDPPTPSIAAQAMALLS